MAYSPRVVANALIRKAHEQGEKLTHMKLQKLVFFMHGWHLATTGKPLLENEKVEAWPYGPVVPSLYHELKHFGSRGIEGYLQEPDFSTGQVVARIPGSEDSHFWRLVDFVWQRYGIFSAVALSDMTHQEGSPWWMSKSKNEKVIPDPVIWEYFLREATPANA